MTKLMLAFAHMGRQCHSAGMGVSTPGYNYSFLYAPTDLFIFLVGIQFNVKAVKMMTFCLAVTHLSTSSSESGESSTFLTTVLMNKDQKIK